MQKNTLLLLSAACILLFSCKKEATAVASAYTPDPFARTDNPSSEVDHQIFLLYQQTSVPVLYSDTLTKTPLTLLNLGYHLTSLDSMITARYLKKTSDILSGIDFVKNQVLTSLSGTLKPYSILLTDSLYTYQVTYAGRIKVPLNAYLGMTTVAIGRVASIAGMVPDSLKSYKKDIFKSIVTVPLNADSNLLKKFYAISAAYYGKYAYGNGTLPGYIAFTPKENYGVLSDGTEGSSYYQMPSQAGDLSTYLDKILVLSATDFSLKYGAYPPVMSKYNFLLNALLTIGFKFS